MFHTDKLTAQFLLTCHIRYRTLICNINKNYNSDFIIFSITLIYVSTT